MALPDIDNLATWRPAHVTVQQLADYWGIHQDTIKRWLKSGSLKGGRIGRAWRIKTDEARMFEMRIFSPRRKTA